MAAPLNQAWEWPVDGHTRPEDGTATNYSNTPGDITPTEHRKLQGKFSHPTTPALSLPGPLARPQSTPCIAEVAKKARKAQDKVVQLAYFSSSNIISRLSFDYACYTDGWHESITPSTKGSSNES